METDLYVRARRAYELGRARHALRVGWPAPAIALATLPLASDPLRHALIGLLLAAVALALPFRGGPAGRAVGAGLVAGLVPLALPIVAMRTGCSVAWAPSCVVACLAGGAAAGVVLGLRSHAIAEGRVAWLAGAGVVAGLTGALGCAVAGAIGLLGMAAALLALSAPVAALARVRTA